MGYYAKQIVTNRALEAIARAEALQSVLTFTAVKTGTGIYTQQEISKLDDAVSLKEVKQSFPVHSITAKEKMLRIESVISNEGVTEEYQIREIGVFARENEGEEFLVTISLCTDRQAVVPVFENVPIETIITDYLAVSNTENFTIDYRSGVYVTVEELRRVVNGLPLVEYDEDEEMIVIDHGSIAGTGAVLDSVTLTEAVKSVMREITADEVTQIFDS